ncbi:MAG: MoaD/ThiS family protein [bacterium]
MKISLELYGPLPPLPTEPPAELELSEGSDVEDLLAAVGYDEHDALRLNVLVNGISVAMLTKLKHGDAVAITLLAGGG